MTFLSKLASCTSSTLSLVAILASVLVGCASVAGYFSQYAQPFELLSHLRLLYLIAESLLCAILLSLRRPRVILLPLTFIVVNLFAILPYYMPGDGNCPSEKCPHVK